MALPIIRVAPVYVDFDSMNITFLWFKQYMVPGGRSVICVMDDFGTLVETTPSIRHSLATAAH